MLKPRHKRAVIHSHIRYQNLKRRGSLHMSSTIDSLTYMSVIYESLCIRKQIYKEQHIQRCHQCKMFG